MKRRIKLDDATLRKRLTPEQYHVTREHGTEPPFSGRYYAEKRPGGYHCICCGEPLFGAAAKYDSGTGWPSFWTPVDAGSVSEHFDMSHDMRRVELRCARCDAHLGHVFPDGPAPTGQRYCINSEALDFRQKEGGETGKT